MGSIPSAPAKFRCIMAPSITNIASPLFHGEILTKNGVDATFAKPPPDWKERSYMLKNSSGRPIGLYKGPVDANADLRFILYQPNQPMTPLTQTLLDPMDYETQIAFETLPVLETHRCTASDILVVYPDHV